jgi:hypothetical protein
MSTAYCLGVFLGHGVSMYLLGRCWTVYQDLSIVMVFARLTTLFHDVIKLIALSSQNIIVDFPMVEFYTFKSGTVLTIFPYII